MKLKFVARHKVRLSGTKKYLRKYFWPCRVHLQYGGLRVSGEIQLRFLPASYESPLRLPPSVKSGCDAVEAVEGCQNYDEELLSHEDTVAEDAT